LGVDAADCLIFEDAPIGIRAAEAAGAQVMVITTTHDQPMDTPHVSINGYATFMTHAAERGLLSSENID
jgi:sugar-phosphatase